MKIKVEPIAIKARLHTLKCHDRGTKNRFDGEPYLWNVFFKVDGEGVTVNQDFSLSGAAKLHFGEGSHGNLYIKNIKNGDSIAITERVGAWQTTLTPLHLPYFEAAFPASIGVVSILMQEGTVSHKGAESGHQRLNEFVRQSINQSIYRFNPKEIDILDIEEAMKQYFRKQATQVGDDVVQYIEEAIMKSQNVVQNLWSLVSRDTLIGYQIWDFNQLDILRNKGLLAFSTTWKHERLGSWQVSGEISRVGGIIY